MKFYFTKTGSEASGASFSKIGLTNSLLGMSHSISGRSTWACSIKKSGRENDSKYGTVLFGLIIAVQ